VASVDIITEGVFAPSVENESFGGPLVPLVNECASRKRNRIRRTILAVTMAYRKKLSGFAIYG
jgi:hypothetical protein